MDKTNIAIKSTLNQVKIIQENNILAAFLWLRQSIPLVPLAAMFVRHIDMSYLVPSSDRALWNKKSRDQPHVLDNVQLGSRRSQA